MNADLAKRMVKQTCMECDRIFAIHDNAVAARMVINCPYCGGLPVGNLEVPDGK